MNIRINKQVGGFTLIELLVVILLVVMLAGVLGGDYFRQYERRQADKTAQELLLAAKYARVVAVERQVPCTLKLDTSGGRFYLTIDEVDATGEEAEEVILSNLFTKPVKMPGEVQFTQISVQPRYAYLMAADASTGSSRSTRSGSGGNSLISSWMQGETESTGELSEDTLSLFGVTDESTASEVEEPKEIQFYPDGTADPAIVQFGTETRPYTLIVSATTGRAKLKRGEAEEMQSDVLDLDLSR
jgi:prepilin-type N-terminal cleavage/methylation domain-containing protein